MVLISSVYAIVSKNPDTRYQPMRDDRGSFIKSQSNLNDELDALAVTARGDLRRKNLDDDSDSYMSGSAEKNYQASQVALPPSAMASTQHVNAYGQRPASPINAATPFIPGANRSRHDIPDHNGNRQIYTSEGFSRAGTASPSRYNGGPSNAGYAYDRSQSLRSETSYRPTGSNNNNNNNNGGGSQWQRGAGYDH